MVNRAQTLMSVGAVSCQDKGKRSAKPQYRWCVAAQAEVAWLMDELYPWLGQRRKAKVDEMRQFVPQWAKEQTYAIA